MINVNELPDDQVLTPDERATELRCVVERVSAVAEVEARTVTDTLLAAIGDAVAAASAGSARDLAAQETCIAATLERIVTAAEAPLIAARDDLRRRLRETVVGAEAARFEAMRAPLPRQLHQPHEPRFELPPDHHIH